MEIIEFVIGFALVLVILVDVFQAVVVPRPTPARFRPGGILVRMTWRAWRRLGLRIASADKRERVLGTFAPLAVVMLLLLWVGGLILGYGIEFHALRHQVRPVPEDLGSALYFAGTSVLTIGFGDIVATSGLARAAAVAAGVSGFGVIALVISLLFSLYGSFQKREVLVVTLDARAGAPPSGVTFLETCARAGLLDDLPRIFAAWENWSAEVLDSHLAYPILAYFRSSHDNESWVSALGAMLDAATLVLTTVAEGPRGPAQMMFAVGRHLVEDLSRFFRLEQGEGVGVERYEFDQARERLARVGYRLLGAEESWLFFSRLRSTYADPLNTMAKFWAAPPAQWIGDRSFIRHAVRTALDR